MALAMTTSPQKLLESLRRTAPRPASFGHLPTGFPELDRALGGGFPRGGLTEARGLPGSGLASLARAALVATTRRGELAAHVDPATSLDPRALEEGGAATDRLLWVRPASPRHALDVVDVLLDGGGFPLVVLDLALAEPGRGRGALPPSAWPRLTGRLRGQPAALLLLAPTSLAGAFARVSLDLAPGPVTPVPGSDLPATRTIQVEVRRNRAGPVGETATLELALG